MVAELEHAEKYQWVGTFWVPAEGGTAERFAGEVTYEPDSGVRVKFSSPNATFGEGNQFKAWKVIHGVVRQNDEATRVTLYNVSFSVGVFLGQTTLKVMNGVADMIVVDDHLVEDTIHGLQIEYSDAFEALLISSGDSTARDKQRVRLSSADPIKPAVGVSIRYGLSTSLADISRENDLAAIFFSHKDPGLSKLKEVIQPLLSTGDYYLRNSAGSSASMIVALDPTKIKEALAVEKTFRSFWELLGDHTISVRKLKLQSSIRIAAGGEEVPIYRSALLSSFSSRTRQPKRKMSDLALHLYTFNRKNHSLSNAQEALARWFEIHEDPLWAPVIDGIAAMIAPQEKLVDRSRYALLISDVETFLDLLGQRQNVNVDGLINLYATPDWKQSYDTLRLPPVPGETAGQFAHEVRNVIAHPKSGAAKAGGRYAKFLQEPLKLQSLYAHIAGLLVKGLLLRNETLDPDALERFVTSFIQARSWFEQIDYKSI
ncbi:hypothetical protein ACFYE8_26355 [Rhizobium leguminosarum]|uniref:ApeA N-terminal domain 1-containing protein n=1 Tax=Rhizobium leguminosarum TaxID=384 RepID=UPI0036DE4E84